MVALRRFRQNKKGVLYVYLVLIVSLFACVFIYFIYATAIQAVQEAINPLLAESEWLSGEHYTSFFYASTFVNALWTFFIALFIFGLLYWTYIYNQRRSAGY